MYSTSKVVLQVHTQLYLKYCGLKEIQPECCVFWLLASSELVNRDLYVLLAVGSSWTLLGFLTGGLTFDFTEAEAAAFAASSVLLTFAFGSSSPFSTPFFLFFLACLAFCLRTTILSFILSKSSSSPLSTMTSSLLNGFPHCKYQIYSYHMTITCRSYDDSMTVM